MTPLLPTDYDDDAKKITTLDTNHNSTEPTIATTATKIGECAIDLNDPKKNSLDSQL